MDHQEEVALIRREIVSMQATIAFERTLRKRAEAALKSDTKETKPNDATGCDEDEAWYASQVP